MAIIRQDSVELMNAFKESKDSIENLRNDVSIINNNLAQELTVIKNIQEYTTQKMLSISDEISNRSNIGYNNKVMLDTNSIVGGVYDSYGSFIHPALVKTPINIFNIGTSQGQLFKNNMNVSISGATKESYKYMLMEDRIITKGITFEEFYNDNITIRIEVNPDDLMGSTTFNTIEMLPYIPGSFSIEAIRVYTMEDYKAKSDIAKLIYKPTIDNVGISRIRLDKNYNMKTIDMDIKLKFKNAAGKYPFGFKHLYFLKADYIADSYVIAQINRDNHIEMISEDININGQNGMIPTNCKAEKIELFTDYENGYLSNPIETSTNIKQNTISKNLKTIYMKVPLIVSISSIQFNFIKDKPI